MKKGTHHSDATRRRISRAHKGVKFSAERRANMKAAALRREARRRAMEAKLATYERREAS